MAAARQNEMNERATVVATTTFAVVDRRCSEDIDSAFQCSRFGGGDVERRFICVHGRPNQSLILRIQENKSAADGRRSDQHTPMAVNEPVGRILSKLGDSHSRPWGHPWQTVDLM